MKSYAVILSTLAVLICTILLSTRFKSPSDFREDPIQKPSIQAPELEIPKSSKINLEDYSPTAPIITSPFSISEHSNEGMPIYTPPPNIPPRAEKSGHCIYEIRVSSEGKVDDVLSLECSNEIYVQPTKHSLLKWKFTPKTNENNQATSFKYGPTKIVYRLTDINGEIIPE